MNEKSFLLKLRSAFTHCGCSFLANMIKEPVILLGNNHIVCRNIDGDNTTFSINTTKKWHLTSPDWISVTPRSGEAGTTKISIKVTSILKAKEDKRNGVITIHQGKYTKNIYFLQRQLSQIEALHLFESRALGRRAYVPIEKSEGVSIVSGNVVEIDFTKIERRFLFMNASKLSSILTSFPKIETLNISKCAISGDINTLLSRLSVYNTELTTLILDGNPFNRSMAITNDICKLKRLKYLSLDDCNITGKIPAVANKKAIDMSEDKAVYTLQKAKRGRGISVVILGDGFTDVEMTKGGYFETIASNAMEAFFCIEPTRSFREYFNVYMVKAISKKRGVGKGLNSAFSSYKSERRLIYGDNDKCIEYAQKAPIGDEALFIITLINDDDHYGSLHTHKRGRIAYCSIPNDDTEFKFFICHECIGHGLGDLSDEYSENDSHFDIKTSAYKELGANLDLCCNPKKIKWHKFLSLDRYKSSVGVFEGGLYYSKGIWRASKTSTMHECYILEFNAPSRYQIVSNIMKLAAERYSFEEFLEYDKRNL